MDILKENSICPSCGYPAHSGHASGCALLKNDESVKDDGEKKFEIGKDAHELIPPVEGLVFQEMGSELVQGDYCVSSGSMHLGELPAPVIAASEIAGGEKNRRIAIKEILSMGKAAFVEKPQSIDGIDFNFLQWKGIGRNAVNRRMKEKSPSLGAEFKYPLGDGNAIPLFLMKVKGHSMLRFQGAAFYQDLLIEAQQSKQFEAFGLRMPKIVETIKFSKEFCRKNSLPIPSSDNPDDAGGQDLSKYVEAYKDQLEPDIYIEMAESADFRAYDSAVLGENMRAFRNVWRVDDIVQIFNDPNQVSRNKKLRSVIDSSRMILSKELGRELNDKEFLTELANILGEQSSILINNRINQGALKNLKQDVTLAGEICDFDGAFQLTEEYLKDRPKWVVDEATEQEWLVEKNVNVDRQLLLLAAHFKPVVDAVAVIGGEIADYSGSANAFVEALGKGLLPEQRSRLKQEIESYADFHDIKAIAGGDKMTESNLAGCEGIFSDIVEKLKSGL